MLFVFLRWISPSIEFEHYTTRYSFVFSKQGFIYDLIDIGAMTRIVANTQRGASTFHREYLQKIKEAKEDDTMVEFDVFFAAFEGKVHILETLNDKLLSQTDMDGTQDETFQTDEYFMEREIRLCRLQAF